MPSHIKSLIGTVIVVGVLLGGLVLLGSPSSQPSTATNERLVHGDSHTIPAASSKVTVVEFADFQCPACAAFHPVLKELIREYQGKVTFVFRHFPLPQHTNAEGAALAAEAAGQQGKFWEMHDSLYAHQTSWSDLNEEAAKETFTHYAQELGLDTVTFQQDINAPQLRNEIKSDKEDGEALGVNGTPTIFINGVKYTGRLTYDTLKQRIEVELTK